MFTGSSPCAVSTNHCHTLLMRTHKHTKHTQPSFHSCKYTLLTHFKWNKKNTQLGYSRTMGESRSPRQQALRVCVCMGWEGSLRYWFWMGGGGYRSSCCIWLVNRKEPKAQQTLQIPEVKLVKKQHVKNRKDTFWSTEPIRWQFFTSHRHFFHTTISTFFLFFALQPLLSPPPALSMGGYFFPFSPLPFSLFSFPPLAAFFSSSLSLATHLSPQHGFAFHQISFKAAEEDKIQKLKSPRFERKCGKKKPKEIK